MKIYFENLGSNIVSIPEKCVCRLWVEINQWEESCMKLEVDGQTYDICDCWDYLQGNEKLCPYTVLDFYNAVVKKVYEILTAGSVEFLDLEKVKDNVIPPFWAEWKARGWVRYDHWD